MRDTLAEQLLACVMGWEQEELAEYRPLLQALAEYKYDEYQQFAPGMKFVESLATWLAQFTSADERRIALDFVLQELIYISDAEMRHMVSLVYPDFVARHLVTKAAAGLGLPEWRVSTISRDPAFAVTKRRTLVLGLSDGARTDVLRRSSEGELGNEQVWHSHEVPPERKATMLDKLGSDLKALGVEDEARFSTLILVDDFFGSGLTYIRREAEPGAWSGKIPRLYDQLASAPALLAAHGVDVCLIAYVGTEAGAEYVESAVEDYYDSTGCEHQFHLSVLQMIPDAVRILATAKTEIVSTGLITRYPAERPMNVHLEVGGAETDTRFGFGECGLPLVLSHNTPNNSLMLLSGNPEEGDSVQGLFPRVSRHR